MRSQGALGSLLLALAVGGCGGGDHPAAATLYQRHCVRCHGADGRGDARSVGLYPGLDLTASRLVRAGSRTRGQIYQTIAEGAGAMPGFSDHLASEEMESLVDYILRLPQGKASR